MGRKMCQHSGLLRKEVRKEGRKEGRKEERERERERESVLETTKRGSSGPTWAVVPQKKCVDSK